MKIIRALALSVMLLGIALIPALADAQVEPSDPLIYTTQTGGTIEFTPPGHVKWVLESSHGDEITSAAKVSAKQSRITVAADPTGTLTDTEKANYPVEVFRLVYSGTDPGEAPKRIDIDPSVLGLSSRIDVSREAASLNVRVPDTWKQEDLSHLYIHMGPHSATYSAVTNTITVTGGTELAPIDFDDIYNADVAGGWGVVTKGAPCTNCFCFSAKIAYGDGVTVTWFADTAKAITFDGNCLAANGETIQSVNQNAYVTFGALDEAATYSTRLGCSFHELDSPTATYGKLLDSTSYSDTRYCYVYSSFISSSDAGEWYCHRLWNTTIAGVSSQATGADVYNLSVTGVATGIYAVNWGVYDNVFLLNCARAVRHYGTADASLSNVHARGNDFILYRDHGTTNSSTTLIDVDSDTWSINWNNSGSATVYRQYSLNLTVTDSDGIGEANFDVSLIDYTGATACAAATSASGTIPQQTLTYATYRQADGDTPTMYSPYTLTISKAGYETYTTQVDMDEAKSLEIAMVPVEDGSLTSWMEDNLMIGNVWLMLFLALAVTGACYWTTGTKHLSLMLQGLAVMFWTGAGIEALGQDGAVWQFFSIPAFMFGIYLFFIIGIRLFAGGGGYGNRN